MYERTFTQTPDSNRQKFKVGDRVRIRRDMPAKHEIPNWLDFSDYDKSRPRTIVNAEYDPEQECMKYTLGSNGKGKLKDGQPLEGFRLYQFRSFQLEPYIPRKYGKRKYTIKPGDSRLT